MLSHVARLSATKADPTTLGAPKLVADPSRFVLQASLTNRNLEVSLREFLQIVSYPAIECDFSLNEQRVVAVLERLKSIGSATNDQSG